MVVRFRCSTPSEPTIASAYASSPHILRQDSTLELCQRTTDKIHQIDGLGLLLREWNVTGLSECSREKKRFTN
jgi:hypothetical protein